MKHLIGDENHGFTIIAENPINVDLSIVLAMHVTEHVIIRNESPAEYVTWNALRERDYISFFSGNYHNRFIDAVNDFTNRTKIEKERG